MLEFLVHRARDVFLKRNNTIVGKKTNISAFCLGLDFVEK